MADGVVEFVAATIGVPDADGDVFEPGALRSALVRRRPKLVADGDWQRPCGRVLDAVELRPGDQRLPERSPDGRPWSPEAGGLLVRGQYALAVEDGRRAYEGTWWAEPGEQPYSLGFVVRDADDRRPDGGLRRIRALDLYALWPVLRAGVLT